MVFSSVSPVLSGPAVPSPEMSQCDEKHDHTRLALQQRPQPQVSRGKPKSSPMDKPYTSPELFFLALPDCCTRGY